MNKKRYAGLMWTQVDKYDYMDTKGLETVRRDNCALVREVIQTSLDKIIIERNVSGAIEYVKSQIADLLQNKMDISRLVITKSLNKGAEWVVNWHPLSTFFLAHRSNAIPNILPGMLWVLVEKLMTTKLSRLTLNSLRGWGSEIQVRLLKWYVYSLPKWCAALFYRFFLLTVLQSINREIVFHMSSLLVLKARKHMRRRKILFMYWRTMYQLIANGTWLTSYQSHSQEFSSQSLTMWRSPCYKETTLERFSFLHLQPRKDLWWCLPTRKRHVWDARQVWMKMRVICVSTACRRKLSCISRSWLCWKKQSLGMLISGQVSLVYDACLAS